MIAGHHNKKFNIAAIKALLIAFFVMAGFISMPEHQTFAFWTYNRVGEQAQHWRITSLIRWPKNDPLFDKYRQNMGQWSEFPDRGKDPIVGHGIAIFDQLDEKGRAKLSFNKAIEHYRKYLANPGNSKELEVAAQCLAHAYHYFEDIADFSEGNTGIRNEVTVAIEKLHQSIVKGLPYLNDQVGKRRQAINPDIDTIIRKLESIKRQRNKDLIYENLLSIVACLEQVNVSFLSQVRTSDLSGQTSDLSGQWRRQDGHVVRFSGSGSNYTGTIVVLTDHLKSCRFSVGEQTFKLTRTKADTYEGQIKWRSPDGNAWWESVQLIVKGNAMTGGGSWVRVGK